MTTMSTSPEIDPAEPYSGDLASLIRRRRAELQLSMEEVAERTRGIDPGHPGKQVVIKQHVSQMERLPRTGRAGRYVIHGLAVALEVPDWVIYGAEAVSLGMDPIPGVPLLLPVEAFEQLPVEEQLQFRALITSLAEKYR